MSPARKLRILLVAAAVVPLAAAAEPTVSARAVTLFTLRPERAPDGTVTTDAPLLEIFSFSASKLDALFIRDGALRISAWGRLRPLELGEHGSVEGDVDIAWAEGRLFDRIRLRLGRQLVFGGAARVTHLDGLSAAIDLPARFRLVAFGGIPVAPRFWVHRGDAVMGARLAFSPTWESEVAASIRWELDRAELDRFDVGLDGRWVLLRGLTVSGHVLYSLADSRIAELELGPHWRAAPGVNVAAVVRRVAPDLLLPRSSIFSVFAENERDDLGAEVDWDVSPALGLGAAVRAVRNDFGTGWDGSAHALWYLDSFRRSSITAQFTALKVPPTGYLRGRLAVRHRFPAGLQISADAEALALDQPINGVDRSLSLSLAASMPLGRKWLVVLAGTAASTPLYSSRFDVTGKIVYAFPEQGGAL